MSDSGPLVSIIMACYNSSRWIAETLNSVKQQTFSDWELLITDDCSTDDSVSIIQKEISLDPRIKLYSFTENQGAGKARNNSLKHAKGRYIAFLDSDDLWVKDKLQKQLDFMNDAGKAMCYADYDIVDENGTYRKTIQVPSEVTYDSFLKRPLTCTHTVIFDTDIVDKDLLQMPDIRRGQDAATWLKVLKTGIKGYAINESLAQYRRHEDSLSNNKFKAIKRTWYLYRKVEHLSLPYACRCFVSYAFNAIKKYS